MTPTPAAPLPWRIRLARPSDAMAYAQCYVECLAETYAHIMPPEFAQSRREGIEDEADEVREELVAMEAALSRGEQPVRTHWIASVAGPVEPTVARPVEATPETVAEPVEATPPTEVVGIVSAGPGVPWWEQRLYDNPEPAVGWNLDHLYTRRSTHGTGLGQALFDTALASPDHPRGRGAWLWILRHNPRAEAFYRRNGMRPDGLEVTCGPAWHEAPMFRMWRPDDWSIPQRAR